VFLVDEGDVTAELERRKFTVEEGDHLTALNAYNAFVKRMWPGAVSHERFADPFIALDGRKSSKWCHTVRCEADFCGSWRLTTAYKTH
jgi:ATP-dependent RNA helicase DDX35